MPDQQSTDTILMVRPANFGFNVETAENNAFQNKDTSLSNDEIKELAKTEFDNMVSGLRTKGITIIVHHDTATPIKSDAVFPNNWFSTHANGSLITYPMYSPNRRQERSEILLDNLAKTFYLKRDDSLLEGEKRGAYLEGTGSMVLDRVHKIVYACYSERTHKTLLEIYCDKLGYKLVAWKSVDKDRIPYYHTNVIMTLGEKIAIICTESIVDEKEKYEVLQSLLDTHKEILQISQLQVEKMAGNMLEVKNHENKSFMVMSTSAYNSLTNNEIHSIEKFHMILHFDLSTIEYFGGGSARCMMAEIFLPKRSESKNVS